MKFIHVYDAMSFDGLVKNDFINEDSGFKVQHDWPMPSQFKFNCVAKKGSKLHSMIKEGNYPFYVDRLAGGTAFHAYAFDKALIDEYRNLLGEWFLGFQLHELGGNVQADWKDIKRRMGDPSASYSQEEMEAGMRNPKNTTPDGDPVYCLRHGTGAEYSRMRFPQTFEEDRDQLSTIIRWRMEETDGMILAVDSGRPVIYLHNKLGVKNFMPEVGGQIAHMRVHVASARGMAQANGKKWGTYYECWFRAPDRSYSQPVYNTHPFNEWYLKQEQFGDDFTSCGPNGGSSRLLQKRIYFYSLMSGAQFMAEEWGTNASYSNMDTWELSPYGLLKKEFIEFTRKHKKMKARVPFAIVLPTDYFCIPTGSINLGEGDLYHCNIPTPPEKADRFSKINHLIQYIFERKKEDIRGNEGHTLQNSRFGDLFDIVYADCPEEAFGKYELLIDADPDGTFARKMEGKLPVIRNDDLEKMEQTVKTLAAKVLPITVDSLHWVLSDDENGHYLTVFNHEGNTRSIAAGDVIDHTADAFTTIHTQPGINLNVLYASSDSIRLEKKKDGEYSLFVPATEMVIFSY